MAFRSLQQAQTLLVLIFALGMCKIAYPTKFRRIIKNLVDLSSKMRGVGILRCDRYLRMLPPPFLYSGSLY